MATAHASAVSSGPGSVSTRSMPARRGNRLSSTTAKEFDLGVNYLIRGPNARLTVQYSKLRDDRVPAPRDDASQIVLGAQLQF